MIKSGTLLALLDKPLSREVPKGWQTVAELAQRIGLSDRQTRDLLQRAVADKEMQKQYFRVQGRSLAHYKRVR